MKGDTPRVRGVVVDATEGGRFPGCVNAPVCSNFLRGALHIRCRDQIDERPGALLRELQLGIPGIGVATGSVTSTA